MGYLIAVLVGDSPAALVGDSPAVSGDSPAMLVGVLAALSAENSGTILVEDLAGVLVDILKDQKAFTIRRIYLVGVLCCFEGDDVKESAQTLHHMPPKLMSAFLCQFLGAGIFQPMSHLHFRSQVSRCHFHC